MCGIAGIYKPFSITQAEHDLINDMNAVQQHRGPDDEGQFHDESCVLGHRRLAIIDLTRNGHQPFHSPDGRFVMVYNGEIYNYIELKKTLESKGRTFSTQTDTEVLLAAFLEYGPDCLSMLNGMFAFAVYDTLNKQLFLARDRLGIKPLYYIRENGSFYFASEIKALRLTPGFQAHINFQSIFDFLVFSRTDVFDETFLENIMRLPKGYYALLTHEGVALKQWWHPQTFLEKPPVNDLHTAGRRVYELLLSSVKLRMRSDVPVGSCLSGGLDSSILIGLLFKNRLASDGYPAFTAAFPGHPIDETNYVAELNRKFPFNSYLTFPSSHAALEDLNRFVYINDEPTTSPSFYSQYQVMKLAKKNKVVVLLDGQGGDENFAGYQYFHGFNLYGLLKTRQFGQFFREFLQAVIRKQHISCFQTLLFKILPPPLRRRFLLRTLPHVDPGFFYTYNRTSRISNEFFDAADLNTSLVRHFQYKLEHLLRMEDRNSMAFSLEARVPYLDHRLVEYILGLCPTLKIRDGETKYIQKIAFGALTAPGILSRTDKIGFGTPGDDWMGTDAWTDLTRENFRFLRNVLPGVFSNISEQGLRGNDAWKINQLATWYRQVKSGVSQI